MRVFESGFYDLKNWFLGISIYYALFINNLCLFCKVAKGVDVQYIFLLMNDKFYPAI